MKNVVVWFSGEEGSRDLKFVISKLIDFNVTFNVENGERLEIDFASTEMTQHKVWDFMIEELDFTNEETWSVLSQTPGYEEVVGYFEPLLVEMGII